MGKGENIPFFASEEVRRLDMDWYKHPVFEQSKLSAKQIAENPLDTSEDIKALEELCEALGVTGEMLFWINQMKEIGFVLILVAL